MATIDNAINTMVTINDVYATLDSIQFDRIRKQLQQLETRPKCCWDDCKNPIFRHPDSVFDPITHRPIYCMEHILAQFSDDDDIKNVPWYRALVELSATLDAMRIYRELQMMRKLGFIE